MPDVRPVTLALTIAALSLGAGWLAKGDYVILGWVALATAAVMVAAWALDRDRIMRASMLISVALWTYAAYAAIVIVQSPTSAMIAFAWAVLAGGTYLVGIEYPRPRP
jgi:hypothetical protein